MSRWKTQTEYEGESFWYFNMCVCVCVFGTAQHSVVCRTIIKLEQIENRSARCRYCDFMAHVTTRKVINFSRRHISFPINGTGGGGGIIHSLWWEKNVCANAKFSFAVMLGRVRHMRYPCLRQKLELTASDVRQNLDHEFHSFVAVRALCITLRNLNCCFGMVRDVWIFLLASTLVQMTEKRTCAQINYNEINCRHSQLSAVFSPSHPGLPIETQITRAIC